MKSVWKKHWKRLLPLLVAVVGYITYAQVQKSYQAGAGGVTSGAVSPNTFSSITMKVIKKSFDSNIQKEGNTKIENEQKLKFASSGRITSVYVAVGDQVKKGQVLATIDSTEASNAVRDAQRRLEDTQRKMGRFERDFHDSVIKKARSEEESIVSQIKQKQRDIDKMNSTHRKALIDQEYAIKEAEKTLHSIEQKVNQTKITSGISGTYNLADQIEKKMNEHYQIIEKKYVFIDSYIQNAEDVLSDAEKILGMADKKYHRYDAFSAEDTVARSDARSLYDESKSTWTALKKSFDNLSSKRDAEGMLSILRSMDSFNILMQKMATKMAYSFERSVPIDGFDASVIDNYKKTYNQHKATYANYQIENPSHISTIGDYIAKLSGLKERVTRDLQSDQELDKIKLEQAKVALENEKKGLKFLKLKQDEEKKGAQRDLVMQQTDLKLLRKKNSDITTLTTNDEYRSYRNSLEQALSSLQNAKKKYKDYVLEAPFAGKVADVKMRVGDIKSDKADENYIAIVDPDAVQINIKIGQSDIIKVRKGMSAKIILDAYPDEVFSGSVREVDTTPSTDNGVPEFKVSVMLHNPNKKKVYSGMKAKVSLLLKQLDASLVVPFTAVASDETGKKYVMRMNGGKKEKVYVEVGYTDGRHYQITKGLKEGDTILEIDYSAAQYQPEQTPENMYGGGGSEAIMY